MKKLRVETRRKVLYKWEYLINKEKALDKCIKRYKKEFCKTAFIGETFEEGSLVGAIVSGKIERYPKARRKLENYIINGFRSSLKKG